ncbi:MAG TPA: 50S ribosomal protein L13 [Capsulimonadaceae bacterium]|nr:50S ribosomal protein L13 [Capsulimonadaceae bacterium]
MTTYSAKPKEMEASRAWYVIDATNQSMGRIAADAARLLRGKHKPQFTPHVDCGDHVIIINAAKVRLTGNNKGLEPIYHHTLWPGGIRSIARAREIEKSPVTAMMRVVKGMLPHNTLGAHMLKKLRVYSGEEHPHVGQKPITWEGK